MTDLEIFHNAPDDATSEQLSAYLDEACGDDAELRGRVEGLFAMGNRTDDFLEKAAIDFETPTLDSEGNASGKAFQSTSITSATVASEKAGDVIGPFTLIEKLGEGGFGTVWKAEQSVPIARIVALKIIKLGMDTREVLTRFEAERQALAMMSHENIAKVLDAGATDNGRPYFVMELVDGVPITQYCDQHQLDTGARLELFRDVCAAVNHAHQKGMIHRDIKPSNVMIAEQDGKPVVKVIDFGIAKATEGKLTEETMLTLQEQVIGTPAYMSPEQAGMDGLDIDTRSDIYSLGVLLYELLSGKPPFDPKTLLSAGFDEMRRIVREEEPPRPSLRVSTINGAEETASLTSTHGVAPERLSRLLRGDLDWIVMKAIEKDRARRYETANAFAADIAHFLADEPVNAAAPSVAYQFRKFARRNKTGLSVGITIAVVLVAATAVSVWQAVRANIEASRATKAEQLARQSLEEAEAVSKFLTDVFQSPVPSRSGRDVTVAEVLDRAANRLESDLPDQPERKARFQETLGSTYSAIALYPQAVALFEDVLEYRIREMGPENEQTLAVRGQLAQALEYAGEREKSIHQWEIVVATKEANFGAEHRNTLDAMWELADAHFGAGNWEKAINLRERVWEGYVKVLGPEAPATQMAVVELSRSYSDVRRWDETRRLLEQAVQLVKEQSGAKNDATLRAMSNLADFYVLTDRIEDWTRAYQMRETIYQERVKKHGEGHIGTIFAKSRLARSYDQMGRWREALKLNQECLQKYLDSYGEGHRRTLGAYYDVGQSLLAAGKQSESLKFLQKLSDVMAAKPGVPSPETTNSKAHLGYILFRVGRVEAALELAGEVHAERLSTSGPRHRYSILATVALADCLEMAGRAEEANELRRNLLRIFDEDPALGHPSDPALVGTLAVSCAKFDGNDSWAFFFDRLIPLPESQTQQDGLAEGPIKRHVWTGLRSPLYSAYRVALQKAWRYDKAGFEHTRRRVLDWVQGAESARLKADAVILGSVMPTESEVIQVRLADNARDAAASDPDSLLARMALAMSAFRKGEYKNAASRFEELESEIYFLAQAGAFYRVVCLLNLGREKQALDLFEATKQEMIPIPGEGSNAFPRDEPYRISVWIAFLEAEDSLIEFYGSAGIESKAHVLRVRQALRNLSKKNLVEITEFKSSDGEDDRSSTMLIRGTASTLSDALRFQDLLKSVALLDGWQQEPHQPRTSGGYVEFSVLLLKNAGRDG